MSLEEIIKKVTGDENTLFLVNDLQIVFGCDCSKERFANGISSLGKDEIEKIILEDKKADVKCHFCNKEYNFTKEELEKILNNIKG